MAPLKVQEMTRNGVLLPSTFHSRDTHLLVTVSVAESFQVGNGSAHASSRKLSVISGDHLCYNWHSWRRRMRQVERNSRTILRRQ